MSAIEEIAAERRRQIEAEGWTPEHDDQHTDYSLTAAAITYAMGATVDGPERAVMDEFGPSGTVYRVHSLWPESWDKTWFKPKGRRRDLVRAAALMVAEIERIDRAASGIETRQGEDPEEGLRAKHESPTVEDRDALKSKGKS